MIDSRTAAAKDGEELQLKGFLCESQRRLTQTHYNNRFNPSASTDGGFASA